MFLANKLSYYQEDAAIILKFETKKTFWINLQPFSSEFRLAFKIHAEMIIWGAGALIGGDSWDRVKEDFIQKTRGLHIKCRFWSRLLVLFRVCLCVCWSIFNVLCIWMHRWWFNFGVGWISRSVTRFWNKMSRRSVLWRSLSSVELYYNEEVRYTLMNGFVPFRWKYTQTES